MDRVLNKQVLEQFKLAQVRPVASEVRGGYRSYPIDAWL